jgi:hypothetical protein
MTEQDLKNEQDAMWADFVDWMHAGVVEVIFEKKDGTMRTMNCTLQPERYVGYEFKGAGTGLNDQIQTVWDVDKEAWRVVSRGKLKSLAWYDEAQ